jgi:hypothetical protein
VIDGILEEGEISRIGSPPQIGHSRRKMKINKKEKERERERERQTAILPVLQKIVSLISTRTD